MRAISGVFDLFKIGIGPSSSHTMGPMRAAAEVVGWARTDSMARTADRVTCELLGSLSATGKGHGTNLALAVGFAGKRPDTATAQDIAEAGAEHAEIAVDLGGDRPVTFKPKRDIVFSRAKAHNRHPNTLIFRFWRDDTEIATRTLFSVGGGFLEIEGEEAEDLNPEAAEPYPFSSAAELMALCQTTGLSIAELALANEVAQRPESEVQQHLAQVWEVMQDAINAGLEQSGTLPGALQVRRRAPQILHKLRENEANAGYRLTEESAWVSLWAIAVNETNAGFGRIVTAPTNGAAGIIPAVLTYLYRFTPGVTKDDVETFLLTAAAFGGLLKRNASISGADVGCQGEVGSAAAMAAAGLAACLGGTPGQIENAAEIALEHHLGMTCDPIGGLVQIPCIERNAMAANKAISAARLALLGDGTHYVSFDQATKTMLQTGRDMKRKYKETSKGGLAINVPLC